jgi:hypothetical protein
VVPYLLKIREEIKKLATGHISHTAALRLEKMPLFANFLKKSVENDRPDARRPELSPEPLHSFFPAKMKLSPAAIRLTGSKALS